MDSHYGSCLIITSQKYYSIPSGMLSNASAMICLRLKKQREIDIFYVSIPMYDNLEDRYKVATEERYSFAYLNLATKKLYKRFVEEIQIHNIYCYEDCLVSVARFRVLHKTMVALPVASLRFDFKLPLLLFLIRAFINLSGPLTGYELYALFRCHLSQPRFFRR